MKKSITLAVIIILLAGLPDWYIYAADSGRMPLQDDKADSSVVYAFIESSIRIREEQLVANDLLEKRVEERAAQVPQIIDIIIDNRNSTALCMDGSVWTWKNKQGKAYAHRVPNLDHISRILCAGPALYAVSEEGDVYVWGSNRLYQVMYCVNWKRTEYLAGQNEYYESPIKIEELSNIKDMGVNTFPKNGRGRVFAIDETGKLLVSGICFDARRDSFDRIKSLPGDSAELVRNVDKVCIGSENNHYFIREDGTIFSIIDRFYDGYSMDDCIYPIFGESPKYLLDDYNNWANLSEGSMKESTIIYEMGKDEGVVDMTADQYTMFLYKNDNTLWYWDNKFIPYHDCDMRERPKDGVYDYSGAFREVDVKRILGVDETPGIADMCAGKENILFLTEDGQVFLSKYVTAEVKSGEELEFYRFNLVGYVWEPVLHTENLKIKRLDFQKINWENIISINTNGEFDFSAVDSEGNYYHLCTETEVIWDM